MFAVNVNLKHSNGIPRNERLSGSQSLSSLLYLKVRAGPSIVEKFLNCKLISRPLEKSLKEQNLLQVFEHDTKC
jgi:hypothetical protein